MKQKILNFITVIMIIATLTFSNFLLLGVNAVSYAADAISIVKKTNNKNVEFGVYFKNNNGDSVTNIDANPNSDSLVLYFKVAVKQEGYFDGKINLRTANFNLKSNILSDTVNKIEDNVIYLNQINAGEEKEIQVGIELKRDEQFDLNLINLESVASIEGIYRDQKEKDISIKADRSVTLNFINTEDTAILTQEVVTNKVFSYNGEEKRIIQLEIKSGLKDNAFPLRKSSIQIQTPKISDKYPEKVLVNSYNKLATNGKELIDDNWNYDETTGMLNIEIENKEDNNIVSWLKDGQDDFIITYVFDKDVEIKNEKLDISSNIQVFDKNQTQIKSSNSITLENEEKDAIVRLDINQKESSVYKGKLYAGIEKDISYDNNIEINMIGTTEKISVIEYENTINDKKIVSEYKSTKFNKKNIEEILGDKGILTIKNKQTDEIIANISKDTEIDKDGNIIINYPEKISSIEMEISSPEKAGKIHMNTTRTIKNVVNSDIKNADKLEMRFSSSYLIDNYNNAYEDIKSNVELKETETYASIEMNRTELSAMTANNNVEFRVVLHTNSEKNELYKNPVIRVELPEKIEKIEVNSINLIDEDELKIQRATLKGNIIEIILGGEQTKYKEEAIDGATIIINTNLSTSKKIASTTEQVRLSYTNQNATKYQNGEKNGEDIKDINIVSYAGVVTTNQISDYGIDVVNNEGIKSAKLEVSSNTKNVDINKTIINNNGDKITDVKILGTFPTKQSINNNNIDIAVGNLVISGIDSNRAKIYYSTNENADENLQDANNNWQEEIEDSKQVKKYLVVINELAVLEEVDIDYAITIPSDLEYNESAEEGYTVYYKESNISKNKSVNLDNLSLTTGIGANIETSLKSYVIGKENKSAKEAGYIRYDVTVTNIGTEDASNIKIIGQVPEGTKYVEVSKVEYGSSNYNAVLENTDRKQVEIEIPSLKQGAKFTESYQVKVDENMAGKEVVNSITTQYGEVSKKSNEVSNKIESSKLAMTLSPVDDTGIIKTGYEYRYIIGIKNISKEKLTNVKVELQDNSDIKINRVSGSGVTVENNVAQIENLEPNEEKNVLVQLIPKDIFNQDKKDTVLLAKAENANTVSYSNEVIRNIQAYNIELDASSDNSGNYVKAGETISYKINVKNNGNTTINSFEIVNEISPYTSFVSVEKNGEKISEDEYSLKQKQLQINTSLEANESEEYIIKGVVNAIPNNKEAIEINNITKFNLDASTIEEKTVKHIMEPSTNSDNMDDDSQDENDNNDNNINNDNNSNDNENNTNNSDEKNNVAKVISGVAWLDKNSNGEKDSEDTELSGITVKLFNTQNNKVAENSQGKEIMAVTNENGFYSLTNVPQGEYFVIFEYDSEKYILTTYLKNEISEQNNSNAILRDLIIDNKEVNVGATDVIKVTDKNIGNINIGLQEAKKFDLKLEKFVSKVTVQNSKGTKVNEFTNASLAKEEIDAKLVNGTTVVVEYIIRVTNEGEVEGYARKLVDYLSSEFDFSSDLNADWYRSGSNIYTTSLANEKIKPGESKEVKLIVTKKMNENSTGLIANVAEIAESYNELGLKDVDSTEANQVKGEDDMSTAELILSIKTGQVVATIGITILIVAIVSVGVLCMVKIILRRKVL